MKVSEVDMTSPLKKFMRVWNNIRVSKLLQNDNFWVNYFINNDPNYSNISLISAVFSYHSCEQTLSNPRRTHIDSQMII